MDKIIFNNQAFPVITVNMPFGLRKISTQELNSQLMNKDGSYVSEASRMIDEEIFYYVDESSLLLSEDEIVKLVLSEI